MSWHNNFWWWGQKNKRASQLRVSQPTEGCVLGKAHENTTPQGNQSNSATSSATILIGLQLLFYRLILIDMCDSLFLSFSANHFFYQSVLHLNCGVVCMCKYNLTVIQFDDCSNGCKAKTYTRERGERKEQREREKREKTSHGSNVSCWTVSRCRCLTTE